MFSGSHLVKTTKFKNPVYIGDPINAVRVFNELRADELILIDILATVNKKPIQLELIKRIGKEAFMPFSIGGGIHKFEDAKEIIGAGAEKVILNSASFLNTKLLSEISNHYGHQSLAVSLDIKKNIFGKYSIYINRGKVKINGDIFEWLSKFQDFGAGEFFLNFIDNDGKMEGYNMEFSRKIVNFTQVPVVVCGGGRSFNDIKALISSGSASAAAAGSMFVFQGPRKAVLLNYPSKKDLRSLCEN